MLITFPFLAQFRPRVLKDGSWNLLVVRSVEQRLLGAESHRQAEQPLPGGTPTQQWGCTVGLRALVLPWSSRGDWKAGGFRETPPVHQKALTWILPQHRELRHTVSSLCMWGIVLKRILPRATLGKLGLKQGFPATAVVAGNLSSCVSSADSCSLAT